MRFPSACALTFALALTACGRDGPIDPPPPGVISLAVGEGRTLTASEAATIEISGGSGGGEFVLIPFYASQVATQTLALDISATQVTGVTGPPSPQVGSAADFQLSRAPTTDARNAAARFHTELRRLERGELGSRLAAIRAARAARGSAPLYSASAAAAPLPTVGDQVTYNTARDACANPSMRPGTVVAVTTRAVIVADNANPAGGFTPEDYLSIAQQFDNFVYPLDVQNFGTPGDIDNNQGHVVVFYTRAVNELTPAGSESVIGGFFHPRDLFPKVGPDPNSSQDDCATSNEAEMFYMLVPDPNGDVNGNKRAKDAVMNGTIGVLGHEFQHLINASRRIANDASSFEEVWLNEGLSHIAEELLFYSASGLAPRQNIALSQLTPAGPVNDAVNKYQVDNFGRLLEYQKDPETRSPYANPPYADDRADLATRGAAWQLLRYAADRSTTAEQTLWRGLVNSRNAGVANFTAVFGGDFGALVRDWATAQYVDDAVASIPAVHQHPSWHYRSIMPRLAQGSNPPPPPPYPLKTRTLVAGTPVTLTLKGGGAAYLRFGIAGGATATITPTLSGTASPAAVSLTVLRTK